MEKRLIAPVLITVCVVLSCVSYALSFLFLEEEGLLAAGVMLVIVLPVIALTVFVLMERRKEIKSGEEDDLGNY